MPNRRAVETMRKRTDGLADHAAVAQSAFEDGSLGTARDHLMHALDDLTDAFRMVVRYERKRCLCSPFTMAGVEPQQSSGAPPPPCPIHREETAA